MKILLASQSPRRQELLAQLGYTFSTVKIDVDEIYPATLPAEKVASYLSELKACAAEVPPADSLLFTADTIVVLDGKVLGKPKSDEEAVEMILALSNKKHKVITAVTLRTHESLKTIEDTAEVTFTEISPEEADCYVKKYQPLDKAGAYGIQEWLGMAKIKKIDGSFYTIMGLPTHLLYEEIKNLMQTQP